MHGRRETRSGRGSATGRDVGLWLVAALAAGAHDPLTSTGKPRWLATCSCGWERACSSEWAARSVSKLVSGDWGQDLPTPGTSSR